MLLVTDNLQLINDILVDQHALVPVQCMHQVCFDKLMCESVCTLVVTSSTTAVIVVFCKQKKPLAMFTTLWCLGNVKQMHAHMKVSVVLKGYFTVSSIQSAWDCHKLA